MCVKEHGSRRCRQRLVDRIKWIYRQNRLEEKKEIIYLKVKSFFQ